MSFQGIEHEYFKIRVPAETIISMYKNNAHAGMNLKGTQRAQYDRTSGLVASRFASAVLVFLSPGILTGRFVSSFVDFPWRWNYSGSLPFQFMLGFLLHSS